MKTREGEAKATKKASARTDAFMEVIHLPLKQGKRNKSRMKNQAGLLKKLALWIAILTVLKLMVEIIKLLMT